MRLNADFAPFEGSKTVFMIDSVDRLTFVSVRQNEQLVKSWSNRSCGGAIGAGDDTGAQNGRDRAFRGGILLVMLRPLSREGFHRVRQFLDEAGYTEPNLRKALGAAELPSSQLRNHARLFDRTSEPTVLNILIRWFWIGIPQSQSVKFLFAPARIHVFARGGGTSGGRRRGP